MSTTTPTPTPGRPARTRTAEGAATQGRRRRKMSIADKIVIGLMVAVPTLLVVLLIWLPALASVLLGFTRWEGIGGLDTIQWIGLTNYKNIFTIYPPFWPALQHNLLFLVFLPGILDLGEGTYVAATGQPRVSYVIRWLALSGALFALSAVWLAIRWPRLRRAG